MNAPTPIDLAGRGSLSRVLLDGMAEGVSLSREDGTIVYVNPAEERMFGYGPGELLGRNVSVQNAMPPEESRSRVAEVIAELRRDGVWRGQWLNRRRDGSSFSSRTRISAVEVEGAVHWLCLREDVTVEAASQRAMAEERARLKLATEVAGIGIWDWTIASGAVSVSDRVRSIFGLPPEGPVTAASLMEAFHPEDRAGIVAAYRRATDPGQRDRDPLEYRVVHADGTQRWVLSTGEAVFEEGPDGPRAVRYLGALQDITARKALERAERDSARRLRPAAPPGGSAWPSRPGAWPSGNRRCPRPA